MSGSPPVQRQGPYIVFIVTVWLFYALPFSLSQKKGSVRWQDFRVNEVTTEIIVLHERGTLLNGSELLGLNSTLLIVDTSTKRQQRLSFHVILSHLYLNSTLNLNPLIETHIVCIYPKSFYSP